MPDKTLGQLCYEAYQAAYDDCYIWTLPWPQLQSHFKRVWETAAQAVVQHAVTDLYIEFSESADTLDVERILAAAMRHLSPPEEDRSHG